LRNMDASVGRESVDPKKNAKHAYGFTDKRIYGLTAVRELVQ